MTVRCRDCVYSCHEDDGTGELTIFVCRRRAPRAFLMPDRKISSYWPPITKTGWCGEFKSKREYASHHKERFYGAGTPQPRCRKCDSLQTYSKPGYMPTDPMGVGCHACDHDETHPDDTGKP
jgi:hypothetical protein